MTYRIIKALLLLFIFSTPAFSQDKHTVDSLQTLLNGRLEDSTRIIVTREMAYTYQDAGKDEPYFNYMNEALELAEKIKLNWAIVNCRLDIATYYQVKSDYDKAIVLLDELMKDATRTKDLKSIARANHLYANIYKDKSEYNKAIEYNLKALKLFEQLGEKENVSACNNLMGNLYRIQGQYTKALTCYKTANTIDSARGDKLNMGLSYNNIGLAYSDLKESKTALLYLQKALAIKMEIGNLKSASNTLNLMGTVYMDMNDNDKALDYIKQALAIKEKLNDEKGMAVSYINMGGVYALQKKYDEAIVCYNKSIVLGKKVSNNDLVKEDYKALSNVYAEMKNMAKAYEYQVLYTNLKDSIYNGENLQQINDMQTKYETGKKEQENKLLQAQNMVSESTIRQQKIISYFIAGGLLLAITLTFFIFRGYREKQKANEIITEQKKMVDEKNMMVEEKNKEILDSIHYARRIQRALLTSDKYLKKVLPEHFVLYKPKDIVSGDFYWSIKHHNKVYVATGDCTGHGVPGAFMSLVGISFLNEIVIERKVLSPDQVLNQLREEIIKALNPEDAMEESKDGMDIVLCCYDFEKMEMQFAAANNSLYLIRDGQLQEFKADKFPVGKYHDDYLPFTLQILPLQKNDCIYSFTDGYADQFGGPQGKKYKYKQLQQQLLNKYKLPFTEQKQLLDKEIETWKGNLEQIDDILIIGIKI